MTPTRLTSLTIALGSAFLTCVSNGAILAYDGFGSAYDSSGSYADPTMGSSDALVWTDGSSTTGQSPTVSGFSSAAWDLDTGSDIIASNVYPRVRTSQTNSYQTATNQIVDTTAGEVSIFRDGTSDIASGTKAVSRNLNIGKSNTYTDRTLYVSGMFTFTTTVVASYFDSASINRGSADARPFGMAIGADGSISLTGTSATPGTAAAGTVVAGQSYFFIWKLFDPNAANPMGSTGDTLTLYLNPTDLSSEGANTATAATSGSTSSFFVVANSQWELDNLAFGALINGGNEFIVDELRVGNTWADVTPFTVVPEPSSAALLGLCGAALLLRRRRA